MEGRRGGANAEGSVLACMGILWRADGRDGRHDGTCTYADMCVRACDVARRLSLCFVRMRALQSETRERGNWGMLRLDPALNW